MSDRPAAGAAPAASAICTVHRVTQRTARYHFLGAAPEAAARIWVVLHGYGQLAARVLRHFDGVVPEDTCVVAPEGLSRFYLESPRPDGGHLHRVGATWLTREDRDADIADALAWLSLVHDDVVSASTRGRGAPPTVATLGFSQGVATMLRWIAAGAVRPTRVVVWAGALAEDVDADVLRHRLAGVEVVSVLGDADELASEAVRDRVRAGLGAMSDRVDARTFVGGHRLDADLLRSLLGSMPTPPAPGAS